MQENKRPLTPYFLYVKDIKSKGTELPTRELAKFWNNMTDTEKKPYFDEYNLQKQKYSKNKNATKSITNIKTEYKTKQIAELLKNEEKYDKNLLNGLAFIAQKFVENIGKDLSETMKENEEKIIKIENIQKVLENNPKYEFITKKPEYKTIIYEIATEGSKPKKSEIKESKSSLPKPEIKNPRKLSSSGKNPETNEVFFHYF